MFSIIRLKPGPDVTVIDLVPVHAAPVTAAMLASSSSIWMKVPPIMGKRWRYAPPPRWTA